MIKIICYVISGACALMAVVSLLDIIGITSMGMTLQNLTVGVVGTVLALFLGRNISHIERDESDRNGPSLRR